MLTLPCFLWTRCWRGFVCVRKEEIGREKKGLSSLGKASVVVCIVTKNWEDHSGDHGVSFAFVVYIVVWKLCSYLSTSTAFENHVFQNVPHGWAWQAEVSWKIRTRHGFTSARDVNGTAVSKSFDSTNQSFDTCYSLNCYCYTCLQYVHPMLMFPKSQPPPHCLNF